MPSGVYWLNFNFLIRLCSGLVISVRESTSHHPFWPVNIGMVVALHYYSVHQFTGVDELTVEFTVWNILRLTICYLFKVMSAATNCCELKSEQ
jgi:hypothetical protein